MARLLLQECGKLVQFLKTECNPDFTLACLYNKFHTFKYITNKYILAPMLHWFGEMKSAPDWPFNTNQHLLLEVGLYQPFLFKILISSRAFIHSFMESDLMLFFHTSLAYNKQT